MPRLPRHIAWIGLHGKNAKFDQIDSRLASQLSKRRFYSILQFRFWCHAHIYSPVFSLILGFVLGNKPDFALTLIFLSIGSLSFAFWDSWGGGYADKHGCKAAIRLGLKLMMAVMIVFACVSLFPKDPKGFSNYALLLAVGAQLIVGLPLALIDAADSELTRKISRQVRLTDTEVVFAEGICSQLKYSGIAFASFIGCLIFIAVSEWSADRTSLAAFIVFMLTAGLQTYALFLLRRVKEPKAKRKTNENTQKISTRCLGALKSIKRERVLMTWVLIVGVTEGWLLFSTSYFQLDALSGFVGSDKSFWLIILTVPIAYGILSIAASKGGTVFNWWHAQAGTSEADDHLLLRGGTRLAIPRRQLIGAGGILVAMLVGFIVHFMAPHLLQKFLGVIAYFTVPPFWQDSFSLRMAGYWLSVITLLFFAFYQFLRGFAHPLLKTTMGRIIERNAVSDSVTTLSIALAGGRFFHAISALLFLGCFAWVRTSEGVASDNKTRALAAMVVIIALAVVILNVFFGVLLDRTAVDTGDSPPFWQWSEIRSMLSRRSFRSITIKGAFFVFLAMSNIIAPKFLNIGWLEFNAGAVCYALTFMLVDSIAETEGRRASRKLWLAGMLTYFVVLVSVVFALLPGGHNDDLQFVFRETVELTNTPVIVSFKTILARGVLGFVIASLCSFSIAQYLDIWIFLMLKRAFRGQALWLRNNISTFLAQAVDTIIFIFVSTAILRFDWSLLTQFHLPNWTAVFVLWSTLLSRVTGQLSVKWGFSLASTVLLYLAVRWIERGTISMRFDDSGKGETVVLLHDFPLNRSMWREQVTLLNSHGYRVITPDLRGLGETRSETTVVRMEDIARDVAALMNELKIDSAILGGQSMGCYVAFEFMQLFPNRVKALVLCGPRSNEPDGTEKQSFEEQAQRALTEGMDFAVDTVVKSLLAEGTLKEKGEVVTRVEKMVMGTNPQGAAAIQRGLAGRRGYARDLGQIKVPTLIITGSEDAVSRSGDAELIHDGIEGSQFVVINDAGHLMNMEQPQAFNRSLIDFLKNQCHKPTGG